jgi:hypothetical protein
MNSPSFTTSSIVTSDIICSDAGWSICMADPKKQLQCSEIKSEVNLQVSLRSIFET